MLEEEFPSPGPKSPGESAVLWHVLAIGLSSAWLLGGVIGFAPPYLIALGWMGICIFAFHVNEEGLSTVKMHRNLATYLYPFLLALAAFIVGLWNQSIVPIERNGADYYMLLETAPWLPVTTLPHINWQPLLLGGALYMTALNMLLVVKAEDVVKRILLVLGVSAAILAIIGSIQLTLKLNKLLGFINVPSGTYFSLFPHPHGWATFALLWTGAMIGLGSHYIRHMRLPIFLERGGIWFLLATAILAASVVITGTPFHLLFVSILLAIAAFDAASHTPTPKKVVKSLFCALGIVVIISGITVFIFNAQRGTQSMFSTSLLEGSGLNWEEQGIIYRESWKLFLEKPLFGWGQGSFRSILALHQSADLGNAAYATAHSDLLQALVEHGLVITLAWISVPVVIFIRFLRLESHRPLSWYLFGACAMVVILSLFGFPFRFPAILFSFWLLWFTAHRWSVIPHLHTTDIARPTLVFTEAERQQLSIGAGSSGSKKRKKHKK